jgi:hypothetical protein
MQLVNIVQEHFSNFDSSVGMAQGYKVANLVNLSTTTRMQLNLREGGNPSMKSIDAISQGWDGIGSG